MDKKRDPNYIAKLEKAISEVFPRISDYLLEARAESPTPEI